MDRGVHELLRGIQVPNPKSMKIDLDNNLMNLKYYTNLKTYIPPFKQLFNSEEQNITFENSYKINNIVIENDENIKGNCKISILEDNKNRIIDAYLKVTHLVDPIRVLQKDENFDISLKLNNPMNQAYVESVASYALGKLRKENISPHFNLFYGAFTSIAQTYNFNISDEVESYRMYKWFWDNVETNNVSIFVDGDNKDNVKEIYDEIMIKPEYCLDKKDTNDIEELEGLELNDAYEVNSLDSASIKTGSISFEEAEDKDEDETDDETDEDEYNIFIKLKNFPTMMIFSEKNESTLDDLLEDYELVGCEPNTKLWEDKWSAWLFQVLASLCVAQTLFGFTHNDLHSNNIVWSNCEQEFLYYKTNNGKLFKVPTYGKIFKIIDFGRSIFSINTHLFISDDFAEGNDAATQFNFPELNGVNDEPKIYPNPSFDLARLAISIFESLFPKTPETKKNALILSSEENRVVKETKSDLFNILWTWLLDKEGDNILFDNNGDERFPDFDLYVHIASSCFNCVPKEQIYKKPFTKFLINSTPKNTKVYSLYV
jgi:hypothetical protein